MNWFLCLLARCRVPQKVIYGCEAFGTATTPYLTRYTLVDLGRFGKINIHHFHRSDGPDMHDHPWAFVSLILAGGYHEVTPWRRQGLPEGIDWRRARRQYPGMILCRRPHHIHRVELVGGSALTLVWVGPRVREWGFWCPDGWVPWERFFREKGC